MPQASKETMAAFSSEAETAANMLWRALFAELPRGIPVDIDRLVTVTRSYQRGSFNGWIFTKIIAYHSRPLIENIVEQELNRLQVDLCYAAYIARFYQEHQSDPIPVYALFTKNSFYKF